jgi:hypothetical protein
MRGLALGAGRRLKSGIGIEDSGRILLECGLCGVVIRVGIIRLYRNYE